MSKKKGGKGGAKKKTPLQPANQPEKKGGLVQYLRATGAVSLAVGFGTFFLGNYFWVAVALVYAAFVVGLIDLYFETTLSIKEKGVVVVIIAIFAGLFSWGIAFRPAPIDITTLGPARHFAAGSNVGGITWKDAFADVRINIHNPTSADYDGFTAMIQIDQPIAKIAQRSSIPNCYFALHEETQAIINSGAAITTLKEPDLVVLATNQPWILHCAKLAAGATVEVEVATASVDLSKNLMERRLWNRPTGGATLELRVGPKGEGKVWMGDPEYNDYLPGPDPKVVQVTSQYTSTFKVHAWLTGKHLKPV